MTLLPSVSTVLEDELSIVAGTIGKKQTQHKVNTLYVYTYMYQNYHLPLNNLKYTLAISINLLMTNACIKSLVKATFQKGHSFKLLPKLFLAVLTENLYQPENVGATFWQCKCLNAHQEC